MDKITFEEAELVEILDGMADIQLTADRIRAVYLDIYEFVSEYDDKTSEDVNDNKYMIYADIVLEQIEKLRKSIGDVSNKLYKKEIFPDKK
ncbi:MAG: hypothetical protein IJ224_09450 [Lachnospiraceae bacterium]|nr:hypothetical protein [Lachnospiraceae bacterium]